MKKVNVLNISGGKDSTAMLLYALEYYKRENIIAVFADTGHEHQMTYDYLSYLSKMTGVEIGRVKADFSKELDRKRKRTVVEKWRKEGIPEAIIQQAVENLTPTGNPFLDMVKWKGRFPSTKARFCTQHLKIEPIAEQIYAPLIGLGNSIMAWQGVRREESEARALLDIEEQQSDYLTLYRPLIDWTHDEIFEMHKKKGIEPNPLYKLGCGRVGCMPCINCRKNELFNIAIRFPEEIDRVERWEAIAGKCSKRGATSFFITDRRGNYIREVVEWSKTGKGGVNYDIIKMLESIEAPSCSSQYGLCE